MKALLETGKGFLFPGVTDAVNYSEQDRLMMRRALEIARRGAGFVSPNPLVGCVIVSSKGEIIGEGAHLNFGGPHAEPNAIADAESKGYSVAGSTVYVTLEPHGHQGKTPPCSKLLIEKKIARCIIAMEDPNPEVNGEGIRQLREAGIAVDVGLLEEDARELNKFFIKRLLTGLPYVTIKIAASLDGRTALANGESRWITSEASRKIVHRMRAEHDAVLIGSGTARADDPELTPRLVSGRVPFRIVLDSKLELPDSLKLFSDEHRDRTIVITTPQAPVAKSKVFQEQGIEVLSVGSKDGGVDLEKMLGTLADHGISSILVEAGPTLARSFVQARLLHELALFIAPKVLGADARGAFGPLHLNSIATAPEFYLKAMDPVEGSHDILLTYRSRK